MCANMEFSLRAHSVQWRTREAIHTGSVAGIWRWHLAHCTFGVAMIQRSVTLFNSLSCRDDSTIFSSEDVFTAAAVLAMPEQEFSMLSKVC
jgi:hypothetical protein